MFIVENRHWNKFVELFHKDHSNDECRFTMNEVLFLSNVVKSAINPIVSTTVTDIYPPRAYFDMYTDLIELIQCDKSILNMRPETYLNDGNNVVSKVKFAELSKMLKDRFEVEYKRKGIQDTNRIVGLLNIDSVPTLERVVSLLYTSTMLYFSKATDGSR